MNANVDEFLKRNQKWQKEMEILRSLLLECHLTEEIKWGKPAYTFQGNNIAILQEFKECCALMFFKGVLLKDPAGVLKKPGKNSRISRRIEFTAADEIEKIKPLLKKYIFEAVEVEKSGVKIKLKNNPGPVPEELQQKFNEFPKLNAAFKNLSPGRQRAYILYFSAPKQSKTRTFRIEKYIPRILEGKGIHDR